MAAVADRLGVPAPPAPAGGAGAPAADPDRAALAEMAFFYCARRVELQRRNRANERIPEQLLEDVRVAFDTILQLIRPHAAGGPVGDEDSLLHSMTEGFGAELELLAPDPNLVQ